MTIAPRAIRLGSATCLAIVPLFAAVAIYFYWPFLADDALITFKYATNLALGRGAVYNAGEPVMAFTSPLHVLASAALTWLAPTMAVDLYKGIGLVVAAASVIGVVRRSASLESRAYLAIALGLASPIVLWAIGGLETPLLMGLVTALVLSVPEPGQEIGFRRLAWLHVLAGLAFLTRYDSVFFTVPVMLHVWWQHRHHWRSLTLAAAIGAVMPVVWLCFATHFYGTILPTSAGKLHFGKSLVAANAIYLTFWLFGLGLLPALLLAPLLHERVPAGGTAQGVPRWLAAACASQLIYCFAVATVHMMFSLRVLVPYLPAIGLLLGSALAQRETRDLRFAALGGVLLVVQCVSLAYTFTNSLNGLAPVGEFRDVGVRDAQRKIIPTMAAAMQSIRQHWSNEPRERAPRVLTFMGGVVAQQIPDAYVYETLVSSRKGCALTPYDWAASADYIVTGTGTGAWYPHPRPAESISLIFAREFGLEQRHAADDVQVYFNARPLPNRVPPRVNDPCR